MSRLTWDQDGERFYEAGTKMGVLFPKNNPSGGYAAGVAWNGLTGVSESPSGAEASQIYADDIVYANMLSTEKFACTITAYTYPDEFAVCDGSVLTTSGVCLGQQSRKPFGFSYRTTIGNDEDGFDKGYKLHFVYGCLAAPSERGYATMNDSPEAITFSWSVSTTPVDVPGYKPLSHFYVDSTKSNAVKMKTLEAITYGADDYSTAHEYSTDDFVVNEGNLYRAIESTVGTFDDNAWALIRTNYTGPTLLMPEEVISLMATE